MAETTSLWAPLHDAEMLAFRTDEAEETAVFEFALPNGGGTVSVAVTGVHAIYMSGWRGTRLLSLAVTDLRGPSQQVRDAALYVGRAAEMPLPDCGTAEDARVETLRIDIEGLSSELESRTIVVVGEGIRLRRGDQALALAQFVRLGA